MSKKRAFCLVSSLLSKACFLETIQSSKTAFSFIRHSAKAKNPFFDRDKSIGGCDKIKETT